MSERTVDALSVQSHKATAGEDVTKLRWLNQFSGCNPLHTITGA